MSGNLEPGTTSYPVDDIDKLVQERIRAAKIIKNLAPPGDTLLQLVEEQDGKRFVTRTYSPRGIDHVEESGLAFAEAWQSMQDIFTQADIPIVRSGIAVNQQESSSGHPRIVMVSEYLEDARPLMEASTKIKTDLASKLPDLFGQSSGYMLSPEVVREDMFVVTGNTEQEQVVMIDIDPLLIKPFFGRPETHFPYYISSYSKLLWENWCLPDEREGVISAFVVATSQLLGDKLMSGSEELTRSFMNAHLMSNGVGPEHLQR